jgi:hypothetical protein
MSKCKSDHSDNAAQSQPTEFSAAIGGYMGRSFQLDLHGDWLIYKTYSFGYEQASEEKIALTDALWRAFIRDLKRIKVTNWQDSYIEPGVCDGTSWHVHVVTADLNIESSGSNAYPKNFGGLLKAVGKLLGGREFE